MARWAKTTDKVIDKGFGSSREGQAIVGAIIHHGAARSVLNYVANENSRNSHPTYHVANDGTVTGIVHPNRQPHSTNHSVDNIAIAFEVDNLRIGGDWAISDKALNAIIEVILDHGNQSERDGFVKNIVGKTQSKFFIGYHSQYHNTECPGPYVRSKIDEIVKELNIRQNAQASVAPATSGPVVTAPTRTSDANLKLVSATKGRGWAFTLPTTAQTRDLQRALAGRGRYSGPITGRMNVGTAKGVQLSLRGVGYRGPIDGDIRQIGCGLIQVYGRKFGSYRGPLDEVLGYNSWAGMILGLQRRP